MRPNGQDVDDPHFAEALSHAASDPALHDWLTREQAFDRAFAASLSSIEPPAHLHGTILAGARATHRTSHWRRTAWKSLAAAAAVALFASVAFFGLHRPSAQSDEPLAQFRADMIHTLEGWHTLDHKTPKVADARLWLASHQGVGDPAIPPGLCDRETIGCEVFEWHGTKVTLICFRPCPSGNPQSASAHLFVVDEKDAPAILTATDTPLFAETKAWTSASWKKDGKLHLLVSRSAMPHLQSLFDG
jgi:hypothetical protein